MSKEKEIELVRLHGVPVHETAEQAVAIYEGGARYRREDLYELIDQKRLISAQAIAGFFISAAHSRDAVHLRALLETLLEVGHSRRTARRMSNKQSAAELGVSGVEYFRRQRKAVDLLCFLVMEILCIALELAFQQGASDDNGAGGAAAYIIRMVPELRPPCPIEEELADLDQEQEYDHEGER